MEAILPALAEQLHTRLIVYSDTSGRGVTAADASRYFVLGTVRYPCDYYVSLWSYISNNANYRPSMKEFKQPQDIHNRSHAYVGHSPPYNSREDRARFVLWMHNVLGRQQDYRLAERLVAKYGCRANMHCWIRTDVMHNDLRACTDNFNACGMSKPTPALVASPRDVHINPSQRSPCSAYFDTAAQAMVMQAEQALLTSRGWGSISELGLDRCCP